MTTTERSLVGIRGWLAVYLAWLYFGLLGLLTTIWDVWQGFSDVIAVGHLVNDLRVVLAFYIVVSCAEAVGIWMIHTRQPKTRQFFLIGIPVLFVLKLLRHHFESAIRAATAGHTLGAGLSAVVQQPQPYYYIIWFALTSVSWLYWFRSERVKQTFTPTSSAVISQQETDVIRLFLVDAILLVLILCWHMGIRSGILGFSTPLRVVLAITWSGVMSAVLRYGFLPLRGRGISLMPTRKFDLRRFGVSMGVTIILIVSFGNTIPHDAYLGIGMAVSYFGLPRWEDKLLVARAGGIVLLYIGVGLAWQVVTGKVTPARASHDYIHAVPAYQRADTLPSLFSPNGNKKAQAASESTIKK